MHLALDLSSDFVNLEHLLGASDVVRQLLSFSSGLPHDARVGIPTGVIQQPRYQIFQLRVFLSFPRSGATIRARKRNGARGAKWLDAESAQGQQ